MVDTSRKPISHRAVAFESRVRASLKVFHGRALARSCALACMHNTQLRVRSDGLDMNIARRLIDSIALCAGLRAHERESVVIWLIVSNESSQRKRKTRHSRARARPNTCDAA